MIRVVIDPGVLVSALIGKRGAAPDLVLRALIDDRIEVMVSPVLLDELERVLGRPKFASRIDDHTIRSESSLPESVATPPMSSTPSLSGRHPRSQRRLPDRRAALRS